MLCPYSKLVFDASGESNARESRITAALSLDVRQMLDVQLQCPFAKRVFALFQASTIKWSLS